MAGRPLNIASPKQLQELLFTRVEAAGGQANGQDRAEHGRGGVGGACPAASAAGEDSRIPAVCEAQEHLRRRVAGDGLSGDGAGACFVQSSGGGHGPVEFERSELAKHSRANARRAGKFARRSCPATRAGSCWRPTIRRSSCGCWPIFRATTQLCAAFARDEDIHARVASQVNGVPLELVTPEMRRAAKAVNFGVVYGQSPFGLARALGIDQEAAAKFIDSYFSGYPGIEEFLSQDTGGMSRKGLC